MQIQFILQHYKELNSKVNVNILPLNKIDVTHYLLICPFY